jgi:hypothetical protein
MKATRTTLFTAAALVISSATPAVAQELLEGDEKDACEAILCLSTGSPPHECDSSLKKYFSIKKKKPGDTIKARRDFLEKCPSSSDEGMPSLINAIVNGAGQCEAETMIPQLNAHLWGMCDPESGYSFMGCMADVPKVCQDYANHPLTRVDMPVKTKTCQSASGSKWGWYSSENLQPGEFYEGGQLCKYEWKMP